jgi:hypothetical protein
VADLLALGVDLGSWGRFFFFFFSGLFWRFSRGERGRKEGVSFDFRLSTFDLRLSTFDFRLSTFDFRFFSVSDLKRRSEEEAEPEKEERRGTEGSGNRAGKRKKPGGKRQRQREKKNQKVHKLTGRDNPVRLPLPEGDLAAGLDDDVHGLSRGLGADDALDGLDLGLGSDDRREREKRGTE